jgi:hypothetical protein
MSYAKLQTIEVDVAFAAKFTRYETMKSMD